MRELATGSVILVGLLQLFAAEAQSRDVDDTNSNVAPYLLFATTVRIYRMNLDGSDREELVYERNFGILGLEYHYRLNSLFWTNIYDPSIKQANLDGSNIRRIVTNGPGDLELRYPVDLALDWINDKLYWTDRDVKKIGVYDLATAERRVLLSTGTGSDSIPFGLAVYPFPGYGWLYWVDRGKSTLEVAAVTGEGREVLESGVRLNCAWPLTLDYTEHTIYWINHCDLRMLSINMDGSQNTRSVLVRNIFFPYGISILNDTIFWTQQSSAYFTDKIRGEPVVEIATTLSNEGGARGIEAVHPLQQPTAEVFREIVDTGTAECDPPCGNGDCVDPGLCYCDRGWTGLNCSTDVNECEISNGRCDHTCTNFIGSFECSCRQGYALKNDNRTCEDANECEISNGGCDHTCTNFIGSFECSCRQGYALKSNNRTCEDVNECDIVNAGCQQLCINSDGSYDCVCFEGYAFNENMTCEDIDECEDANGGCEHNCTNLEGSYECTCLGELIVDIDGRSCVCFDGFALNDNMTCEDIDECEILNGGCDHNCTNYEGSYECSCLADFVLGIDGRSCECSEGYATKDNITCEDINECKNSNGGCLHNCANLEGSYKCSCLEGFTLGIDGRSCEAVVETTTLTTPTSTSPALATSTTTSILTSASDETSPVLEASRLSTSVMPTFIINPQQSSTPHPSPTIPPHPLPSSNRLITASSSSSTHSISSFVPSQSSTTVLALQSPPATTSSMQMPDHSISTTHTSRPSVSMELSPPPDTAEPKSSSSTLLVIVAAAASAGVIALAVIVVSIAIIVYRRRAHKLGSWSPPRRTADSPTDSIKFTSSVRTPTTFIGDSNGKL